MPVVELNFSYLITYCHIPTNKKKLTIILIHRTESFFRKLIVAKLLKKLLNRNVHDSLHKRQPLIPFLKRMKLLHTTNSYQSSFIILTSNFRLCLIIVLLPSSLCIDSFLYFSYVSCVIHSFHHIFLYVRPNNIPTGVGHWL